MTKIKKIVNKLSNKIFSVSVFRYFAKLSTTRKRQIVFVGAITAILVASSVIILAANNRGDSPYIYLRMDEGAASTTNDSMNNVDGTLQGGATWKQEDECVSGKCLYLDGDGDYVSIPDFSLE
ncbi:MAG: hypothetical protein CO102_00825 [Candidatus Brennerbacteria bacterium CG_4_9_14_3_um_filter_43_9]|uniref:Uncharacterized protein n=1 Tax=Candidatus Brennerbacteria bacterium CG_4_9_14_3_um_filter_43_9 TaxID=1974522 RepID=A0A2M8C398_9BACT|nr:MAG: hypothetical protein CO102_00825 [Candidatus Brennerbacteria bacterium CG_4_9_14_3_um_filter_43_9]